MTNTKTCLEDFDCYHIGKMVSVSKTYRVHPKGKDLMIDFDCEGEKDCGVLNTKGEYNWKLCVHPELRESTSKSS